MRQSAQKSAAAMLKPHVALPVAAGAVLAVLALGGYAFDWTWTGFPGNTLWDWLQLLVLPVALAGISIWFGTGREWRQEWMALLIGIGAALAVLAIGGYLFDWTWTGFPGNTLWDWLKLLLLPVVLTGSTIWFSTRQKQADESG